jgi:hypothetical protein
MKTTATRYLGIGLAAALVALATVITAQPASAASHQRNQSCQKAYNTQANPYYGFGPRVCIHPHDVVSGDRIVARDPDPFIRGQLLRAYHSGNL